MPRRRRPIQWGVFWTAVALGVFRIYAASQVSHEGRFFEGVNPLALIPAALIFLVGAGFFWSFFYVRSVFVFDDHGIRVYAPIGSARMRTNDYLWDRVFGLRLDSDVIVAQVSHGGQMFDLLVGPTLTPEERLKAFDAISAIASDAGSGFVVEPHA